MFIRKIIRIYVVRKAMQVTSEVFCDNRPGI